MGAVVFFGGFNRYDFAELWQRSQEIVCWLARDRAVLHVEYLPPTNGGWPIYAFNAAKRVARKNRGACLVDNVRFFFPAIFPWPWVRSVREINKFLVEKQIGRLLDGSAPAQQPIVWISWPSPYALDYARDARAFVVYDCMQNFQSSVYPREVGTLDTALTARADIIFADSYTTFEKKRAVNDRVHYIPQGVKTDWLTLEGLDRPIQLQNLPRPVLGYVGSFHRAFDFKLIARAARAKPRWTFVLIGERNRMGRLPALPANILFLGWKDHGELPNYIANFDVALIPYLVDDQTEGVFPTKFFEYLCCGTPVVSTVLPSLDVDYRSVASFARTPAEFIEACDKALAEKDHRSRQARKRLARENTWEARFAKMSEILETELSKGEHCRREEADV
ncbi:MAG: glycosyltransferase [Candidatus Aquicultorales bacterium]